MAIKKSYKISLILIVTLVPIASIIGFKYLDNQKKINELDLSSYLWSKRVFSTSRYNFLRTEKISSQNTIAKQIKNSNEVLWIRNTSHNSSQVTDLNHVANLLHLIKEPLILVTSDGDRAVPSSYSPELVKQILSSPKIKRWYTQNYDKSIIHQKLDFYPIGLDMHTRRWLEGKISTPESRLKKFSNYLATREKYKNLKKNKIFCDAHLSITHPRRKEIYEILKNNKLIEFQGSKIPFTEIIRKYARHRFVLSPRGNGIDCHRTWEVFLLGSIVITESSSLDDMYIKNDLPVIILKNFDELNNITEEQLEIWYNENHHKTSKEKILDKFQPRYWIKETKNLLSEP